MVLCGSLSPRVGSIASLKTIKHVSLAIGIIVMALSGSLFSFASLGTDLKARFGFNSSNINLLAAIGDTAMYVGFLIVGPIYDHYGERWTLIAASVLTFLGYGGIYFAYAKAWGGLGFLMVLYCLSGVASTAGYLAALAANMANFSAATSGTVSGILLAFFGLSATLFSQIKTHLFSGDNEVADPSSGFKGSKATQDYLLFLTIITTAIYMIAAPAHPLSRTTTFTPSMKDGCGPSSRLQNWNQSSTTLDKESTHADGSSRLPGENILEDTTPAPPSAGPVTTTDTNKAPFNPYLTSVDMKPKQLLFESTFWFFVIAQVSQQGFSYINNVDSIIHAILDPSDPTTVVRATSLTGLHVTLISIGNCIGRLASGIISDWVIARYRISRSIFFFGSEVLILIPLLIMGFSTPVVSLVGLVISSCLIGATYGATGALFASMTRDFFGNKYYGSACGMVMVLNGANPFIANQLYGLFYDRAVQQMPPAAPNVQEGTMNCVGRSCYDSSFKVASLLQLLCILSAGLLFWAHMRKGKRLMQKMTSESA
ncbi:major facilitator superfamily domain-containing protein [Mortierella sp. GBAus27b]|nr:major facilitator superfamily domain-containing protein [Mortierella sp. GBAus27b]